MAHGYNSKLTASNVPQAQGEDWEARVGEEAEEVTQYEPYSSSDSCFLGLDPHPNPTTRYCSSWASELCSGPWFLSLQNRGRKKFTCSGGEGGNLQIWTENLSGMERFTNQPVSLHPSYQQPN